jgi:UDP-glucose 4-epimerase
VRAYIYVVDLARGCIAALDSLAFEAASGRAVPYEIVGRRRGDVVSSYPHPAAAEQLLGWRARCGIERMCEDHWRWHEKNPCGFG